MQIDYLLFTNIHAALRVSVVTSLILVFKSLENGFITRFENVLHDFVLKLPVFPVSVFKTSDAAR